MAHKELVYLKGFCKGKEFWNTLKAIHLATVHHDGQFRKSGEPYIDHPMRVTSALVALKVHDDEILATSILHDVVEDCDVTAEQLESEGIDRHIVQNVIALSKHDAVSTDSYYRRFKNPATILTKISDRCHNISSMVGAFSVDKMKDYVRETEDYVLPLCRYGTREFPEYSDQIFAMRYHIESVLKAAKGFIQMLDEKGCA